MKKLARGVLWAWLLILLACGGSESAVSLLLLGIIAYEASGFVSLAEWVVEGDEE